MKAIFATAIVTAMMSGTSLDRDGILVTATTIGPTTTRSIPEIAMAVIATMTRANWGVVRSRTTVTKFLTATQATAMTFPQAAPPRIRRLPGCSSRGTGSAAPGGDDIRPQAVFLSLSSSYIFTLTMNLVDDEAVELVRDKIKKRDRLMIERCKWDGRPLPAWIGHD